MTRQTTEMIMVAKKMTRMTMMGKKLTRMAKNITLMAKKDDQDDEEDFCPDATCR